MRDFEQAYVSPTLQFFKNDFMEKWKFKEYTDSTKPTVFLGLYTPHDLNVWQNHKSYKILYFGGNDCKDNQLNIVSKTPNTSCIGYGGKWLYQILDQYNIPYTSTKITLKDYSSFTPTTLGENIYVYKGIHGNRPDYYKWESIVKPLQQVFGEDRVIFTDHLPMDELIEKYYKNCFIYIKPNERAGSTAMIELGYMGRKTITTNHNNFHNVLESTNLENTIKLIMEESTKIGTIQTELHNNMKSIFQETDEWLYISSNNFSK